MSKSTQKAGAPAVDERRSGAAHPAARAPAAERGAAKAAAKAAQPKPAPEPRPAPSREENLRFWSALKRTDPRHTKPFTRSGGFRGTQIDPTWRLQMMTELFGPVGKGWGYEQLDWTIAERMVFVCLRVWWRDPETGEQCWTGPQWGGTEMVARRRDGVEAPNDEAFKMSVTDALGKCLLQLGLGADVHTGQFDDSKYREEAEAYWQARDNPETQPAAVERFEAEIKARLAEIADLDGLDELWRNGVAARVREIALVDRAAQMRIISLFSQKKAELQKAAGGGQGAAQRQVA